MNETLYLEPLDKHTNDSVIKLINGLAEESVAANMRCADGQDRDLIAVSVRSLIACIINRRPANLEFDLFQRTDAGIVPITVVIADELDELPAQKLAALDPEEIRQALRIMRPKPVISHGVMPFNAMRPIRPPRKISPTRARKF